MNERQKQIIDAALSAAWEGAGEESDEIAKENAKAASPAWSFNLLIFTPGTHIFEKILTCYQL